MTDRPTSAVEALGRMSFEQFTSLSAVHGDGWGMAWRDEKHGMTRACTSPISAAADPMYREMAEKALGAAGLVHLRWATDGLVVERANTHPFTDGNYALAHNGSISPIEKLERLLSTDSRALLVGDTDSERYFRFVLQCIEDDGEEAAGLSRAVGILHDRFPNASLNALFITSTQLFAVHVNSAAVTPLDDLRQLFASDDAMPVGHATAYFDMAYRATPTAVQIISSGLAEGRWLPLPVDRILSVDLATREIELLSPLSCASTL